MRTPQAIYELSRAYGEAQSAIDRVCLKLDEMNIKPCELLEILNIKHSFCDGIYSFQLKEITTGDIAKMSYDNEYLTVEYFGELGSRGLPQRFGCPTAGTLLREILYNINFNRVLSASLVNLLHNINRTI